MATVMLVMTIVLEIIYRGTGSGDMPGHISIVNACITVMLLFISCCHTGYPLLHVLVAPTLTCLVFAYLCFVDYDITLGSIYYS